MSGNMEDLVSNIFDGDDYVLDLIERYDVENDDDRGYRLLHEATKRGHKPAIKLLIEKGASVNCDNHFASYTPLHWAVMSGDNEIVELLLDKGAKMTDDTWEGLSPFYLAVSGGEEETHTYYGPDRQDSQTFGGIRHSNPKIVDLSGVVSLLVSRGSDINQKCWEGQSPLHVACQSRSSLRDKTIKILLEQGAIVNSMDHFGNTPLHVVAESDVPEPCALIEMLQQYGADINAKTVTGETPLHVACRSRTALTVGAKVVEALIRAGANVNAKCFRGNTPLHMSLFRLQVDMALALLNRGADLNAPNKENTTPLHYAVRNNNKPILRHIAKQGIADISDSLQAVFHRGFSYFRSCKEQIVLMKSTSIETSTVTFFDILVASDSKIAYLASNKTIRKAMETGLENFPDFSSELQKRWISGQKRSEALDRLKFVDLSCGKIFLTYDCLLRVANYLSTEDLENFILGSR